MPEQELTYEQAEAALRRHGSYGWLIDEGPEIWSASELAEMLTRIGIPVSRDTVARWFRDLLSYQNMGVLGSFASRRDVIMLLAGKMPNALRGEESTRKEA